jgi:3-(3-hydroxy-phenyl)propionate hydroxylase
MPKEQNEKVVIAGGGPVGMTTALLLAQAGIPSVVLEQGPGIPHEYRASTFHPPTLDLLEDSGITDGLLAMGLVCPTMQYRDRKQGKIVEFDFALIKDETRYPFRLQCEQFKLVGHLDRAVRKTSCVEVLYGHELVGFEQSHDSVAVQVESPDGRKTIQGRYLVGADGGRSVVRHGMDVGFDGFTYQIRMLLLGTPFDFRAVMPDISSVNYIADPEEHCLLLQIPDLWRISVQIPADMTDGEAVTDAHVSTRLSRIHPAAGAHEVPIRSVYKVHQRVATSYRKHRVFLAGDAAHLNNPKGGMGLNGGLHDAINLVGRIARVWHGDAPETELDGYEAQRRPAAVDDILKQTDKNIRTLAEADPDARERNFSEWRRLAADPEAARAHLLQTSMISSLRRTGMLS